MKMTYMANFLLFFTDIIAFCNYFLTSLLMKKEKNRMKPKYKPISQKSRFIFLFHSHSFYTILTLYNVGINK